MKVFALTSSFLGCLQAAPSCCWPAGLTADNPAWDPNPRHLPAVATNMAEAQAFCNKLQEENTAFLRALFETRLPGFPPGLGKQLT